MRGFIRFALPVLSLSISACAVYERDYSSLEHDAGSSGAPGSSGTPGSSGAAGTPGGAGATGVVEDNRPELAAEQSAWRVHNAATGSYQGRLAGFASEMLPSSETGAWAMLSDTGASTFEVRKPDGNVIATALTETLDVNWGEYRTLLIRDTGDANEPISAEELFLPAQGMTRIYHYADKLSNFLVDDPETELFNDVAGTSNPLRFGNYIEVSNTVKKLLVNGQTANAFELDVSEPSLYVLIENAGSPIQSIKLTP